MEAQDSKSEKQTKHQNVLGKAQKQPSHAALRHCTNPWHLHILSKYCKGRAERKSLKMTRDFL